MKKRLTISLTVMAILMFAMSLIAGCSFINPQTQDSPVKEIKIKEGTVKAEYVIDATLDYSNIYIVATKEDGSTQEVKLTDEGVEYTSVDTSDLGEKTLTVNYQGKECSISFSVVKAVMRTFVGPQAYDNYLDNSAVKELDQIGETEFAKKGNPYVVGTLNKFEFVPESLDSSLNKLANPRTTYKLFIKEGDVYNEVSTPDIYVLVEQANMYKFTSTAIDKAFKLEIYPDEEFCDISNLPEDSMVEVEFVVKEAYNVYDTLGLSVLDNLNVNNWAKLKDQQLKWDDKKLSEYTDVELIVIHNDIAIDPDKLPSNYFWSEDLVEYQSALTRAQQIDKNYEGEGTLGFANRLKGSLRDGVAYGESNSYSHGGLVGDVDYSTYAGDTQANTYKDGTKIIEAWENENMQKGLFNTNQCSIAGNYMTISVKESATRHLTTVVSSDSGDGADGTAPVSHWSIFKFFKTSNAEKLNLSIENISMVGNMGKGNNMSVEAGLNAINSMCDELNISNVKTTKFYIHLAVDQSTDDNKPIDAVLNFSDSRMTNAYSSMFYLWRSKVNVVNSIMENAGGPLFLMFDGDRDANDQPKDENGNLLGDDGGPVLKVDDKSRLESYAMGTESWYQMYGAQALITGALKPLNTGLSVTPPDGLGKTFVHNRTVGLETKEMINIIAAIIPNAGSIMNPPSDKTINSYGKFVRTFEEEGKADEVFALNCGAAVVAKSYGTFGFMSGKGCAALTESGFMFATYEGNQDPYRNFATNSSDMLAVLMRAGEGMPYFGIILGDYLPVA